MQPYVGFGLVKRTQPFKGNALDILRVEIFFIDGIFATGIFRSGLADRELPLLRASVTYLLIHLNDAMAACAALGARISFAEDCPTGMDVTDLISKCRGAACHIDSANTGRTDFHGNFGMMTMVGKTSGVTGQVHIANPYDDDIAVVFGDYRLFIRRHCQRAFEEIQLVFQKMEK